jgi:hypothetical protein
MAKFDISYVIKAINKFSPIAKQVAKSAKDMQKTLANVSLESSKMSKNLMGSISEAKGDFSGVSASVADSAKKMSSSLNCVKDKMKMMNTEMSKTVKQSAPFKRSFDFRPATTVVKNFNHNLKNTANNTEKVHSQFSKVTRTIAHQSHIFEKFSDKFATSAYFRFMNIGFPIMGITVPALKDLADVESASVSLKAMVNNFGQLNEQAKKFAETTMFSQGEILKADQSLANMGLSGPKIAKVMKGAVDYAAAAGISVSQAVNDIAQAAIGMHAVGTTGVMSLKGTASARAVADAEGLAKKYAGIAAAQSKTITGQLKVTFDQLNDSVGQIITVSGQPVINLFKNIVKVVGITAKWASNNKTLATMIGYVLSSIAIFLGLGITFGAVVGVASFAVSGLSWTLKIFKGVMYLVRGAMFAVESASIILGNVFVALEGKTILTSAAMKAFRLVMLGVNLILEANPITIVITALVALGAAIYEAVKHWDAFKTSVVHVFGYLKSAIKNVVSPMSSALSAMISPLKHAFSWFEKLVGIKDKAAGVTIQQSAGIGVVPGAANQGAMHNVNINVHGTNAQVTGTSVKSTGMLGNAQLNLATNYSGGY